MKRLSLAIVGLLVMSSLALAQAAPSTTGAKSLHVRKATRTPGGFACGSDPILPTDGLAIQDFVDVSSMSFYLVHLKNGHSYSAEVYDAVDGTISATPQLVLQNSTCSGTLPTTDVTAYDPDLSANFSARISWIQPGDSDAVLEVINPDAANSYVYMIRVVDTTLYNPRWSTFSGFVTQYALVNNTESPITGTLTLYDQTGAIVTTAAVSVAAGAESFKQIGKPVNTFGFATFAYVGPAGAITADANIINSNATVIVPSPLAPRNYQH